MTRNAASWFVAALAALAASAGCVSQLPPPPAPMESSPPETNVYFYPVRGQSPAQQDRDKYECNTWAVQQSGFDPSLPNVPPHLHVVVSNAGPPPGSAVAAGAVTGAFLGAAVSRPWQAGSGALVGALAGAAIGGLAENAAAQQTRAQLAAQANNAQAAALEQKARNYRRAMSACLEGRGYNVR
ncbi:MAG TPA: hypothetical protein VHW95_06440 [Steroidobacteraceae bacterium]|nr:hypothetical protein [Steroidobacteraceae bacterium]